MDEIGKSLSDRFGETVRLKDGINLKELTEKFGSEFTVSDQNTSESDERDTRIDETYEYEEFSPHMNLECIVGFGEELPAIEETPFEQIKKTMYPITKDKKLFKRIIRLGKGKIIPPDCVVYFNHNSYFELEAVPFDSSYLQARKPLRMQLGVDGLYYGMHKSLTSMKVGERAQFLVDPSYAFGSLGVPPRIPPNATILLDIELYKIVDSGAAVADLTNEEKEQFNNCYNQAKAYHALGNDFFIEKKLEDALKNYQKAENSLLECKITTENQEKQLMELLLKVLLNKCVIYNKMGHYKKVVNVCEKALLKCPGMAKKSAKLFFSLGQAHVNLNEYEQARTALRKAYHLAPLNKDINKLLQKLERKFKNYLQNEKEACQRMFGFEAPKKEVKLKDHEIELLNEMRKEVAVFASSKRHRLQLPAGHTHQEENFLRQVAQEFGLFVETTTCGKRPALALVRHLSD